MKSHLMQGLMEGKLKRFPCTKKCKVPFGRRVRKSEKQMAERTSFLKRYRNACVGLGNVASLNDIA